MLTNKRENNEKDSDDIIGCWRWHLVSSSFGRRFWLLQEGNTRFSHRNWQWSVETSTATLGCLFSAWQGDGTCLISS
jgi:hypothetical protein